MGQQMRQDHNKCEKKKKEKGNTRRDKDTRNEKVTKDVKIMKMMQQKRQETYIKHKGTTEELRVQKETRIQQKK